MFRLVPVIRPVGADGYCSDVAIGVVIGVVTGAVIVAVIGVAIDAGIGAVGNAAIIVVADIDKERLGSREGILDASTVAETAQSKTVRSAMTSPLQPKAAWETLWEKYKKNDDIKLGHEYECACHYSFCSSIINDAADSYEIHINGH
ncbi:hypothetical protein B0O99DRAFT_688029 [Bisporella sp. PMI_857]|nr:hypothetical protein B0O99DRAFT_688029 [Bisporella sp. PMI_857]